MPNASDFVKPCGLGALLIEKRENPYLGVFAATLQYIHNPVMEPNSFALGFFSFQDKKKVVI